MKKIEELSNVFKYSFIVTLFFMFIFITLFNLMTFVEGSSLGEETPIILLYASIVNNCVGLLALIPVYMNRKQSWLCMAGWFCFYIIFLLLNIMSGWVVNATGYLMLFFGIALILLLKEEVEK